VIIADTLIVDIHGGGWFRGDKGSHADLGKLLAKSGYTVVIPNFSLAPEYQFPEPIDDLSFFFEQSFLSSFDVTTVGILGASAGGNLAIELALKYQVPTVSWSGVFDIEDWLNNHTDVSPRLDTIQPEGTPRKQVNDEFYKFFTTNYVGNKIHEADLLKRRLNNDIPPIMLFNSTDELIPLDSMYKLAYNFGKAGGLVSTHAFPGTRHASYYMDDAIEKTIRFFNEHL
jgi:acetyl esterase/lipase